jgi:hypothetical protein
VCYEVVSPHRRPQVPPFIVTRRRPGSTRVFVLLVVIKGDVSETYSSVAGGSDLVLVVAFGQEEGVSSL